MPLIPDTPVDLPVLRPSGVAPANPVIPSAIDTIAAAFRQDNPVVSLARRLSEEQFPDDPDHNPLSVIGGTEFEQRHADRFLGSRSGEETFAIMRRIAAEEQDRKILDASGFGGTVAQISAGMLDPTIALPAGTIYRAGKTGWAVGRSTLSVGAMGALQAGIQEAVLQGTHETRTLGESAASIGSAAILSGLLGMGASALLSRAERNLLTRALDRERSAIDVHGGDTAAADLPRAHLDVISARMDEIRALPAEQRTQTIHDEFEALANERASLETAGAPSTPGSVGAAASDTRALTLESSGLGFSKILSTTRRVLSSGSTWARRTMADLAESPYRFVENLTGQASTQGPPLDRLARMEINGARVEVADEMERLFSEYRFGDPEQKLPRLKARFEDLTGGAPERLSYTQFKEEVSRALIEGDSHAVPQVQQAAQFIRKRVFEPWKERAIAAKLLPEGIETTTAASYFHRVYNKERIRAQRPFFVNKVVDWLVADQAAKRGAQGRLRALNDELQALKARIEKPKSADDLAEATALHDAIRSRIEAEIAAWEGKSVAEAKAAMKAREKYATDAARAIDAPRLAQADDAIDKAVQKILASDRDLDVETLRARAHEITERILGSPDGRLPYDIPTGGPQIGFHGGDQARGPLAAREFHIPDALIRDFLEQDVEAVTQTYLRTMVPDVLLTEKFGDVRMTEAFKRVEEDYAGLIDATKSKKEAERLGKERDATIRDLAAVRDRIRHVFGWSPELRNMARAAAGAKAVNNLTSMGVAAVSSLPDFAGTIFRWGLGNAMSDGWAPFLQSLMGKNDGWDKFKAQMRAVGIGIEVATNARQHALDDVMDVYKPGSRFERGLQAVNDKFFLANLLAPLTDVQKTIAAHVSVSEILRASKAAAEGKASRKQIANLAESGIDQNMAGKIWAEFQKAGEVVDGVHLPNTQTWAKDAADALNGAVAREVDITVVTPGQEKPLWMSHPVISVIGQFKAFTAAATERVLVANLMRRDASALQGVVAAMALGMLAYKINSFFGGQPTSSRPQDWIKEGISRGGLLGWFEEGNALASKMSRGGVDVYRMLGADKPLSRFASRSTLDMLLGPTAAKVEGLAKVTGALGARLRTSPTGGPNEAAWTEGDTKALRRLMAFQNLFWLRGAFNQVEAGANSYFGIPHRPTPQEKAAAIGQ